MIHSTSSNSDEYEQTQGQLSTMTTNSADYAIPNSCSTMLLQKKTDFERNRPTLNLAKTSKDSSTAGKIKEIWKTSAQRNPAQTQLDKEAWRMSNQPRRFQQTHKVLPDPITEAAPSSFVLPDTRSKLPPKPLPQEPATVLPAYTATNISHTFNTYTAASSFSNTASAHQSHGYIDGDVYLEQAPMQPTNSSMKYPQGTQVAYDFPIPANNLSSYPSETAAFNCNQITLRHPNESLYSQHVHSHNTLYSEEASQQSSKEVEANTPSICPSHSTKRDRNSSQVSEKDEITNSKKPIEIHDKKVRQITVQSINAEHRAWIDILPSETGLSLAEKIHILATFRTKKIVSITTASNRRIPLDNRLIVGNWMETEDFKDGEQWSVEWCENDRGAMDKLITKFVHTGVGNKRKLRVFRK